VSSVSTYADVTPNSEAALLAAIAQQPVSVALEADQSSFQFYSSGVMTAACGTSLSHAGLAVGYGTDAGTPYYKVRRRWASHIMLPLHALGTQNHRRSPCILHAAFNTVASPLDRDFSLSHCADQEQLGEGRAPSAALVCGKMCR